jgi:hypothetical protein
MVQHCLVTFQYPKVCILDMAGNSKVPPPEILWTPARLLGLSIVCVRGAFYVLHAAGEYLVQA